MSDTYHTKEAFNARLKARREDPCAPLPLQTFWHIGCLNNWRDVVQEQYDLFQSVGLRPIAGVLGSQEDAAWIKSLGIEIGYTSPDMKNWETLTLQMLWEWCLSHPAGSVLYVHSKGVTAPTSENKRAWRHLMAYYVIKRWRHNLHRLAVADVVGVDWQHSRSYPHFSGNFWMARSDWISHLPSPLKHRDAGGPNIAGHGWRRMHCEMWLGSRPWHHVEHLCCQNTCLWRGEEVHQLLAKAQKEEHCKILEKVLMAGSDDVQRFGGRFEGGLHIQQVPEELADLVVHLQGRPYANYLEIGAAAGGTARFLRDALEVPYVCIIDDNQHPKHGLRSTIIPDATEWIGNSHDPACAEFLAGLGRKFDLVMIDGDHRHEGVAADLAMVLPHLSSQAVILLHDITNEPGVRRLREEIRNELWPGLCEVASFVSRYGIAVIQYKGNK
jgi:hypothetical protein